MTKKFLIALIGLFMLGIAADGSKGQEPVPLARLRAELYKLDVEDAQAPNEIEIMAKWARTADINLILLFNEATDIIASSQDISFHYKDNRQFSIRADNIHNGFYQLWTYSQPPDEEASKVTVDPSALMLTIRIIPWDSRTYYFVELVRVNNRVEEFGILRIISGSKGNYRILARQEDALPDLKNLDRKDALNTKRIGENKLEWIPDMHFESPTLKSGKMLFTFYYAFGVSPNGGGCPRSVLVDWMFDGKRMTPLKMNVLPWDDCLVSETKKIHHEGKEFVINNE